jgi:hypothetical protein
MGNDEEEVASGLLPFVVGGKTILVPELVWRANRAWQKQLQESFIALAAYPGDTPEGVQAIADSERELILAYDVTHALGDLENATEREIDAIYSKLTEVAFPQASSQVALVVGIARAAVASAQASSTSGRSPTGTIAAPPTLKGHSRSAKSRSSTGRRRSG